MPNHDLYDYFTVGGPLIGVFIGYWLTRRQARIDARERHQAVLREQAEKLIEHSMRYQRTAVDHAIDSWTFAVEFVSKEEPGKAPWALYHDDIFPMINALVALYFPQHLGLVHKFEQERIKIIEEGPNVPDEAVEVGAEIDPTYAEQFAKGNAGRARKLVNATVVFCRELEDAICAEQPNLMPKN